MNLNEFETINYDEQNRDIFDELEKQLQMNEEFLQYRQMNEEYERKIIEPIATTRDNSIEILQRIKQNCWDLYKYCEMQLNNIFVEPNDFKTCSSNINLQIKALNNALNNIKTKPTIEEQLQILHYPNETQLNKLQDAKREFEKISLSYFFNHYEKKNKNQTNFKNNIYFNKKSFTNDAYEDFFNNKTIEKSAFARYIDEICDHRLSKFREFINKKTKNKKTFRQILDIYYINLFERVRGLIL